MIATAAAVALAASTVHVAVKDDVYVKDAITVSKGTRVRWDWDGKSKHDVTVLKGPATFRSSIMRSGSYTKKLTKKGTYSILCSVHAPDMKMTIRVK